MALRRASSARRPADRQYAALGPGDLIRAKRNDDWKLKEEYGFDEPQVIAEFSGQSVKRAKELELWLNRVKDARHQATQADVNLAASLQEAKELQEELELARLDLAQLRIEAEQASKQRKQWEGQLEVSRSCIRKLESRLLSIRRLAAADRPVKLSKPQEDPRAAKELEELVKQRDRLMKEREALKRQEIEYDREVRSLSMALRATTTFTSRARPQSGRALEALLKQELISTEEQIKVSTDSLEQARHELFGLQSNKEDLAQELKSAESSFANAAFQRTNLAAEEARLKALGSELALEAAAARREETAAREEAAALQLECNECTSTLRKQQAAKSDIQRRLRELEASVAQARRKASAVQAENRACGSELEARCQTLRGEIEQQAVLRTEGAERRKKREEETSELEARADILLREVEASRLAGLELEAAVAASQRACSARNLELRAQEVENQELSQQLFQGNRYEEVLQEELIEERRKAQEANEVASSLLERRKVVSEEAAEALRLCDEALLESETTQEAIDRRDAQLKQSERSSELMHNTLGQQLARVHEQVREAEAAHTKALAELRQERWDHTRLTSQLQRETEARRSRFGRPLLPTS